MSLSGCIHRVWLPLIVLLAGCAGVPEPESTDNFPWQLPAWLPPPVVPSDNPMTSAKVALGEKLFNERRLSFNETTSCASCHRPELAFADGRQQSLGATGAKHRRNAMTLVNGAYSPRQGWADSNLDSLEAQIRKVLYHLEPVEMGWTGYRDEILQRIEQDPQLKQGFVTAFPNSRDAVTEVNTTKAIASYLRTLLDTDSAYDRWVYLDDVEALEDIEKRGMGLFFSGRLGCSNCHSGFNFNGPVAVAGAVIPPASYANTGLVTGLDQGLGEVTGLSGDRGRFRVPTLRNLGRTDPYMHDGRFASLQAVLAHYQQVKRPDRQQDGLDPRLQNFTLTVTEQEELIAFLKVL